MKKQYIITEAKQIKTYIEKNKKIPLTNTYEDGKIYSIYTTSYLMANLIRNWSKNDINKIDVIKYDKKTYTDTINEKVIKEDYLQMIKKFLDYCKTNHRVPTYIISIKSNTKISFELFTYCLTKIIVYLSENKVLPNYCFFNKSDIRLNQSSSEKPNKNKNPPISNCTNPYKSLPINANSGCDAMGQNTSYFCGVCALQKVLYKFGINVNQKTLASLAGTTTKGTSHEGLKTAIAYIAKKNNVKLKVQEYNFNDLGFEKLGKLICKPNVDAITHIKYRLEYGHYEKIKSIDVKNKQIEVVNSLGSKCKNNCYCGYIEKRSFTIQKQYFNAISQKSIILITKEG